MAAVAPLTIAVVLVAYVPTFLVLQRNSLKTVSFLREMTEVERRRGYVASLFTDKEVMKEIHSLQLGDGLISYHQNDWK